MNPTVQAYMERFGFAPLQIEAPPTPELGLVVTIPCHDEPHLEATLTSLAECAPPPCDVEVLVIINAPEGAPAPVAARTAKQLARAENWIASQPPGGLRFHLLYYPGLPRRQSGVGLARKIAMDEAAARLHQAGHPAGVISGLDADCRVSPDYLCALEAHFRRHPATNACSIRFEHPLEESESPRLRDGIIQYELYLRYFVAGLRHAGHPHAFHTVGSSMAVRAGDYMAQGGMNRRQAGEDFYFLGKFMTLDRFTHLHAATVFPAARPSHRVPFGTGRALRHWLDAGLEVMTGEAPEIFLELQALLDGIKNDPPRKTAEARRFVAGLPPSIGRFLDQAGFPDLVRQWRANTAAEATFQQRFFRWFDRFRILKFAHAAREWELPERPVPESAAWLLARLGRKIEQNPSPESLLNAYRALESASE